MKETDPEFFEFLQKNQPELLQFGQGEDEDDEEEEEAEEDDDDDDGASSDSDSDDAQAAAAKVRGCSPTTTTKLHTYKHSVFYPRPPYHRPPRRPLLRAGR